MNLTGLTPDQRAIARRSLSLDDESLALECQETFFIASGPGGQHRNKTESGVRLEHLPTGLVITATERRSQAQNRSMALFRLREKLYQWTLVPQPRRPTRPTRGSVERRLSAKRHSQTKKNQRRDRGDD